jgi:hypothetical protein
MEILSKLLKRKPRPPQRFIEVREAIRQNGGCLMVIGSLVLALVVLLIKRVGDILFGGAVSRWLEPASDLFWRFAHAPIGLITLLVILGLCAAITAAILIALWETRPRRDKKPRKLTQPERDQIHPLRAIWGRDAHGTLSAFHNFFAEVIHYLTEQAEEQMGRSVKPFYWARLLNGVSKSLEDSIKDMDRTFAPDSQTPLDAVIEQFNRTYGAYTDAYSWLLRVHLYDGYDLEAKPYGGRFERWKQAHRVLFDELDALNHHEDYEGRLAIHRPHLWATEAALHGVVQEIQKRPERGTQ